MDDYRPIPSQEPGVFGRISYASLRLLAAICMLLPIAALAQQSAVLTNIGQMLVLPMEKATNALPVELRGTVTFYNPDRRVLYVQDQTGAIAVSLQTPSGDVPRELQPGQMVDVQGVTASGGIHPLVKEQHLRLLKIGPLPAPVLLKRETLFSTENDARWVKVSGFIYDRDLREKKSVLRLAVHGGGTVTLRAVGVPKEYLESLQGTEVEVTGTLAFVADTDHRPTGSLQIWIPDIAFIHEVRPIPIMRIDDLESSLPHPPKQGLVRVCGRVTNPVPGRFLQVRDDSGTLLVPYTGTNGYVVGGPIEVFGYPDDQTNAFELRDLRITSPRFVAPFDKSDPEKILTVAFAPNTNLPELTKVVQVRNLSAGEAARGYPVRLSGILTYNDFYLRRFIQDDSGGIYVAVLNKIFDRVSSGERVEIRGFSGPGGFAPVIEAQQVRVLAKGAFPMPRFASIQNLMTGSEDSQWVAVKGVVRSQSRDGDDYVLSFSSGSTVFDLVVPNIAGPPPLKSYVDAGVSAQGVCATIFDNQRQLQAIRILIPTWDLVRVEESAPEDAFALPVRPIKELLQFWAGGNSSHRSHLQGVVSLKQTDDSFYLQDATGGVLVQPLKPAPEIRIGDQVEITGFPSAREKFPVLQDAVIKHIAGGVLLEPVRLQPDSILQKALNGMLVRVEGRVVEHSSSATAELLTVQIGKGIYDAVLEKEHPKDQLGKITTGSMVGLTGVYAAQLDDNQRIQSFRLLLRSAEDVALISSPPWWTARRAFWVLGISGAALVLALAWVSLLRKQVQRQTRELRGEIEERKRMEEQMERTHQELMNVSRQVGMAEVASNVLHNVGNVLNSVNVSVTLVAEQVRHSSGAKVSRVAALMREHAADLGHFFTHDPKAGQLPDYMDALAGQLTKEEIAVLEELTLLRKNVEHIKHIVTVQQEYARTMGVTEIVPVVELAEDALRVNASAFERHQVELVRDYAPDLPDINVDKHKVLQILINLLRNARFACNEVNRPDKRIIVRISRDSGKIKISVTDNGVGILPENMTRIFNHGFTTRKNGHGFGLHSGALAAKALGGSLQAFSDGPGSGATFTLELPIHAGDHVKRLATKRS